MKQLPDSKVYGVYRCTHLLGITSSGAVYKAYHRDDRTQEFALRTLQIHAPNMEYVLQECDDYMVSLTAISAPNIIPVVDYGHEGFEYYVVMPYIKGVTLRQLIKQTDKTPESMPALGEISSFTQIIGNALKSLHDLGIAHGAIEPRNILMTTDNQFYLADVGLARLLKLVFSLENTGSFWTGKYTAPEVWDGERITPSSDLYSLACVIYHLVTGRVPFDGKTIFDQMEQHKSAIITPPHYIRQQSPFALTMFFLTATAKTPPERFRSVNEFVNEFASSIVGAEGEPTTFFNIRVDIEDGETPKIQE